MVMVVVASPAVPAPPVPAAMLLLENIATEADHLSSGSNSNMTRRWGAISAGCQALSEAARRRQAGGRCMAAGATPLTHSTV